MSYIKKSWHSAWPYVLSIVLWHLLAVYINKPLLLPNPLDVFSTLADLSLHDEKFIMSVVNTLESLSVAWVYSIGILLVSLLSCYASNTVKYYFSKMSYLMQPLPTFSILPIAMVLFGINQNTVNFLLIFSSYWVSMGLLITAIDESQITWDKHIVNLGWSKVKAFILVFIPCMIPFILSAMKLSWTLMYRNIIALELTFGTMGSGWTMGRLMLEEKNNLNINEIYAIMVFIMLVGITVNYSFDQIKKALKW